jgi:putative transposase
MFATDYNHVNSSECTATPRILFNALAETVIGWFKTEGIRRRGPWQSLEAVEFATLAWIDWFNTRLLEPIGQVPPAEFEAAYYPQTDAGAVT